MVIAQAPLTLVPKGAKPPPESVQEVLDSELFSRTQRKSICYADGARAWPAAAKQVRKGFKFKQVSHVRSQFTKKTRKYVYGTQTLDRAWMWMKRFLGHGLKSRVRDQVNPALLHKCFQFVWRHCNSVS